MTNDILEQKIKELTNTLYLSGSNTRKEAASFYEKLCKPIYTMVQNNNKDIKSELFTQAGIQEKVKKLVGIDHACPGLIICYGTANYAEIVIAGNQQEYMLSAENQEALEQEKMTRQSIFDLASVTKLFSCLVTFNLHEKGLIDFQAPVSAYDDRFKNIGHLTILNLMGFQKKLETPGRIDQMSDYKTAERLLFEIKEMPNDLRPYSDMGAMILKYIIESITQQPFFSTVQDVLLKPNKMKNTNISYQPWEMQYLVSNNFEMRLLHDKAFLDVTTKKGIVHDKKARLLGQEGKYLSGHAGLFSTVDDMRNLLQNILAGKVVTRSSLLHISKKQIGFQNEEGKYSQYLGMLCHVKHPKEQQSEVYKYLSDAAFSQGGYTGTYFSLDPLNGVFVFLGTNRCHHRTTSIRDCTEPFVEEYKAKYPSSKDFAWERDELCHCALNLALQYKYLEELSPLQDQKNERVYNM